MPPSLRAILRSGYRPGMPAQTQSTAAQNAVPGNIVTCVFSPVPGEPCSVNPLAPQCSEMTVSVSSHALKNGSQCSWSVIGGRSSRWGDSRNDTEVNPRSALRRTSSPASTGSLSHGSCIGMNRSGWAPCHSSIIQLFQARMAASPTSSSRFSDRTLPVNPHAPDGKHNDAQTPSRSMSRTRWSTSQQARRISSKFRGSSVHSERGRPATTLRPVSA